MDENDASKVHEASPWAADKRAAEIVRPAPVRASDSVPPTSLARDMAFARLQSRILSTVEAVQFVKLHHDVPPEQHTIILSAFGPGTGTCWTAMHKSPNCHRMRNGGWPQRYGWVQRRKQARAPRVLCAKAMVGDTCEQSLVTHPFHSFCCKYGRAKARVHRGTY